MRSKFLLHTLTLSMLMTLSIAAQEKKVEPTSPDLFKEIERADSLMFQAFNTQDMSVFKAMFTEDLEWFQDNGGLIPYKTVFENFGNTFRNENKLSRELVKGSLEVYPIKDYGAIQIGRHQFKHMENGKLEIGTFKFLMIWQKKDEKWRISRVISYDH
jgi:ketosteroid isomerase-like protein